MSNYLRGDLLIYTNKGIKRIDKLSLDDLILTDKNIYTNIEELNKIVKKNYYLYRIKISNTIDNYYLDGNNKVLCIQNIPYELKLNECNDFIKNNLRISAPSYVNVNSLTEFDYVGLPYDNDNDNDNDIDNDNDKYRFYGLILLEQSTFNLNNNLNKNTIGFLNKYLHNYNIPYEIFNNNITTTIKFNINDIPDRYTDNKINYLSKKNIKTIIKGFRELYSVVNTTNKIDYYILKNIFFKIGILLNATYINNNYVIKIPDIDSETDTNNNNYFIYDNYIWCKVKKINKTDKYSGFVYSLKTYGNSIVSEIGVIS
jgi:hypothetical protein